MLDSKARSRPRRIALLVSSMGRGGAERVAATLCNAWVAQGRKVSLIATYLGGRQVGFPLHRDVRLVFLSDLADMPRRSGTGPIWKLLTLRRWLAKERPDVVVSFLPNVNVMTIAATRGLGLPVIVCERADPAAGVEMGWPLHVARWLLYPLASGVAVQTASAAGRLRRRLLACRKMLVIPNPLPSRLSAGPPCAPSSEDGGLVIAVGRLSPEKGFDLLLRAFHAAFSASPRWRLEIWGEGPLREPLLRLSESLGLEDRAVLRGPTDEPWAEMSRAQIFALTSAYEGFPNAMLEAMALGLATVSFDCQSGPRDLTDGGRVGVLVAPGDVAAFAREMRALADDRRRREFLGIAGSEYVRGAFSEKAVLAQWDASFETLETQFTS
jgi:GalNAc-alpha-(1->4)-GalNAc-alpha-(1->3)-diNAcBac-PP-undecaprenol alpha-1,4-N-acetyl-D-galactosaminyltransferase